jgi:putative serine protease PepD
MSEHHRHRSYLFLSLAAALGLLAFGLVAASCSSGSSSAQTPGSPTSSVTTPATSTSPTGTEGSTPDVYARVSPAIVQITGLTTSQGQQAEVLGSGIVIDSSGNILTNYHVISGASDITVTLSDEAAVSGQVVGTDPADDLAVVKADFSGVNLTVANLGDSSQVRIGQSVIAIGNPFGLQETVTEGVISGNDRSLPSQTSKPLVQLFQTDAAINPGNSGGALVDLNGNVVGINTALENPSGQDVFIGIGYAIPINDAKDHLPDMLAGKTIVHARLGASTITVNPALAKTLSLSVNAGAYVVAVDSGGPAAQAGLQAAGSSGANPLLTPKGGDVIVGADSTTINTSDDLINYIDHNKAPRDSVTLHVVRGSNKIDISGTRAAWPNPEGRWQSSCRSMAGRLSRLESAPPR